MINCPSCAQYTIAEYRDKLYAEIVKRKKELRRQEKEREAREGGGNGERQHHHRHRSSRSGRHSSAGARGAVRSWARLSRAHRPSKRSTARFPGCKTRFQLLLPALSEGPDSACLCATESFALFIIRLPIICLLFSGAVDAASLAQGRCFKPYVTAMVQAPRRRPRTRRSTSDGNTAAIASASAGTTTAAARTGSTGRRLRWKPDGSGESCFEVKQCHGAPAQVVSPATEHAHFSTDRLDDRHIRGVRARSRRQFHCMCLGIMFRRWSRITFVSLCNAPTLLPQGNNLDLEGKAGTPCLCTPVQELRSDNTRNPNTILPEPVTQSTAGDPLPRCHRSSCLLTLQCGTRPALSSAWYAPSRCDRRRGPMSPWSAARLRAAHSEQRQ